jgi:predicted transcriptional regulator
MKEKELKDKFSENRFTSANTLSESEFSEGIKKAEKGPFYTVQESMTEFESWLKKRKEK